MPSTGTPRLSPFPFVLSDLLTPGGGGGGAGVSHCQSPWQQSRVGDMPAPQRNHPAVGILWWLERVVLVVKVPPFTPASNFVKPAGAR